MYSYSSIDKRLGKFTTLRLMVQVANAGESMFAERSHKAMRSSSSELADILLVAWTELDKKTVQVVLSHFENTIAS